VDTFFEGWQTFPLGALDLFWVGDYTMGDIQYCWFVATRIEIVRSVKRDDDPTVVDQLINVANY